MPEKDEGRGNQPILRIVPRQDSFFHERETTKQEKINYISDQMKYCVKDVGILALSPQKYLDFLSNKEYKPRETIVIEIMERIQGIYDDFGDGVHNFFIHSKLKDIERNLHLLLQNTQNLGKTIDILTKKSVQDEIVATLKKDFEIVKNNYLSSWSIKK